MSRVIAAAGLALISQACVYSDHSVCSPDKLEFDPTLSGTWLGTIDPGKTVTAEIQAHPETRTYSIRVHPEPKKEATFPAKACLVALGGEHYGSLAVDEDELTSNQVPAGEFITFKLDHRPNGVIAIAVMFHNGTNDVNLYGGLQKRLLQPLIDGEGPAPDHEFEFLAVPTAELQKAIVDPARRGMFQPWATFQRVAPAASPRSPKP